MSIFGDSEHRAEQAQLKGELEESRHELRDLDDRIAEARGALSIIEQNASAELTRKWEYVSDEDVDIDSLDERGARGWELVSAVSYTVGWGVGGNSSMKVHIKYIFKRPVAAVDSDDARGLRSVLDQLALKRQVVRNRQGEIAAELSGGI